jgi:hypothetical protein
MYGAFMAAFVLLMLGAAAGMGCLAYATFAGGPADARWPSLLAALTYLYAPYLVTNTYIRGALAEVAAMALLPWVLWAARRLVADERPARAILPLAFSLGALAVTHNITLLFAPPLLVAYLFVLWWAADRPRQVLLPCAAAILLAMGLSAFFWLPLLLERNYIAGAGFEIARTVWLPGSVWRMDNFLDGGLTYDHTFARPIRLGVVQGALALAGALCGLFTLRRRSEWGFWIAVALLSGLLMSAWALPLWLASDVLVLAQFTWRLLSVQSLALALLTGGLLTWRGAGWLRLVATVALMALVVLSARPRLAGWMSLRRKA